MHIEPLIDDHTRSTIADHDAICLMNLMKKGKSLYFV